MAGLRLWARAWRGWQLEHLEQRRPRWRRPWSSPKLDLLVRHHLTRLLIGKKVWTRLFRFHLLCILSTIQIGWMSNNSEQEWLALLESSLIFRSLIIVSGGLMFLLFTLLCLRCRRNRKCCCCFCCAMSPSASCEFPGQNWALSLFSFIFVQLFIFDIKLLFISSIISFLWAFLLSLFAYLLIFITFQCIRCFYLLWFYCYFRPRNTCQFPNTQLKFFTPVNCFSSLTLYIATFAQSYFDFCYYICWRHFKPDISDQPVIHSLAELSSQRQLHQAEPNIYLPLTTFLEQPMRHQQQQQLQQQEGYFIGAEVLLENAGLDYPEEPPPAYSELYPLPNVSNVEEEVEIESQQNRDQETSEMLSTENVERNVEADERQLSLTRRRSLT